MTPESPGQFLDPGATDPDEDTQPARVYPLVGDPGNNRLLETWLAQQDEFEAVDTAVPLREADADVCIVDVPAFREHEADLRAARAAAEPVLLPVLLILSEDRTDVIDTDEGQVADNVLRGKIDEVVSVPIRKAELAWRVRALLRLRQQSLAAQRQNEYLRLFREAIDASGHAVYITDTDGTIRYVNPAFEEITGYAAAEAVGETPALLSSGTLTEEFYEDLWSTILEGETYSGEFVNRRADGEVYTAQQTIAPVTTNGEVRGFVAVQNDVTDRIERAETLTRRTEAIDAAPVGISISDPNREDNPLIYVNDAFCSITGYEREEVLGRNCRFLQGENTDPERVATVRDAIDAEEPIAIDLRNYRKDGTEFWNHLEIAPVTDEDGTVNNWIGFQTDVTARRERRRQLQVLDRVLRHDLRNHLTVIGGQAELIRDATSGKLAESADRILAVGDELFNMTERARQITDLLLEEPTREDVSLAPALETIRTRVARDHPTAEVSVACPDDVTVRATKRLPDAIEELVTNAIIHNDATSPVVEVSVTDENGTVRVAVADNGPPIPAMERELITGAEDRSPLRHASGLGFWFVSLVVERSGGSISFADNTPTGNVVAIELSR